MKKSFLMQEDNIKKLLNEIKIEQKISPLRNLEELIPKIKEGIYDIENDVGYYIDFDDDLKARSLLKNYVLFADHNLLAEFKEKYFKEYIELQFKYNKDSNI